VHSPFAAFGRKTRASFYAGCKSSTSLSSPSGQILRLGFVQPCFAHAGAGRGRRPRELVWTDGRVKRAPSLRGRRPDFAHARAPVSGSAGVCRPPGRSPTWLYSSRVVFPKLGQAIANMHESQRTTSLEESQGKADVLKMIKTNHDRSCKHCSDKRWPGTSFASPTSSAPSRAARKADPGARMSVGNQTVMWKTGEAGPLSLDLWGRALHTQPHSDRKESSQNIATTPAGVPRGFATQLCCIGVYPTVPCHTCFTLALFGVELVRLTAMSSSQCCQHVSGSFHARREVRAQQTTFVLMYMVHDVHTPSIQSSCHHGSYIRAC